MADQIATAAKHRLTKRLGSLSGQDMDSIEPFAETLER